jgi:alpha-D-xyloside xylohydrolase
MNGILYLGCMVRLSGDRLCRTSKDVLDGLLEREMSAEIKLTRRGLAKGIAASGAFAGLSPFLGAETQPARRQLQSGVWQQVHLGVWRATLGMPEKYTPVSSRLVPPKTEAFAKLPVVEKAPLSEIRGARMARGYKVELPLRPQEQIFGLGLQFMSLAQRDKKKVMRVNADPKMDTGDSHAPVPFYVTTEGLGVLIDTARYATFYFGNARPRPKHAQASTSQANPDPNYTQSLQDVESGTVTVEIPSAAGVDVYLFAGPSMLDAVKRYNVFSGGGFVPPEWGLGFWYRMDARATQETAIAFAREFRDHNIPCDVLGLEPGWQTHAYSCTFAWNKERFPDANGFVRTAGDMHYKVNLWEHAYTHPASPIFEDMQQYSGDCGVWGGVAPDFAGEQARNIFGAYHGKTFIDAGVSGFKLDECDNSDFTGGWSFPELSSFPSGVDGEQMHSVFGLRYQMAIWDEFRKRNRETYNLVRSSGALATPYPFVLYSDLYAHRDFIRALVTSGFSGLLWCPEVRDAANEVDLIRRLQSVVFSPLAMINAWYIKNPPWKQLNRRLNNSDKLLDEWEKLEARCREIIGWRMQLVPYLTAAFQRYAEDGTPPFRALALDEPGDKRLHKVDDQYMVGDRMMVAPLFAEDTADRKVVLPAGRWHDFWTGEVLKGGTEIALLATMEKIPVYVKTGSVIPWADVGAYAGAPETRRLTVRVYGDGRLPFELGVGGKTMRLTWNNGKGRVDGEPGDYMVKSWSLIG